MPEYLAPSVFLEEISFKQKPIEGVDTSTTGFVGGAERGPSTARLVTSWRDFTAWFGDIPGDGVSFLPFAARGFFDNGGRRLIVARATRADAATATLEHPTADPAQALRVSAAGPGAFGNRIRVRVRTGASGGLTMTIVYYRVAPAIFVDPTDPAKAADPARRDPDAIEEYAELSGDAAGAERLVELVNASSRLVTLAWSAPSRAPARPNDGAFTPLAGGADGDAPATAADFLGVPSSRADAPRGLAGLATVDDVAIVSVPDEVNEALLSPDERDALRNALVDHCERARDRIAVLNGPASIGNVDDLKNPRNSGYAALYTPWVRVADGAGTRLVPPSGHVAGVYARTDLERGVHKAPANDVVRGLVETDPAHPPLAVALGQREQDILNPRGINVIRDFRAQGRGIRIWGARTTSSDSERRYVNVRRLLIHLERSIDRGTQWAVFEPNGERLWASVRRSIGDFLYAAWRSGALLGDRADRAFFVRCDRSTMTQADLDEGRLVCEVGVAVLKPAEFVIFRIGQKTASAE